MTDHDRTFIEIGLTAAIVAVDGDQPSILATRTSGGDHAEPDGLPTGPFEPVEHRTLEIGLRAWVKAQTALPIGYVEQLYTFGDRGRGAMAGEPGPHVVSIGYLALTRRPDEAVLAAAGARFRPWYAFFPWEDWRRGRPALIDRTILPLLNEWAQQRSVEAPGSLGRPERVALCFGTSTSPWDEEKVLERYELLYEAGLVDEARRDGRPAALARQPMPILGLPMRSDHRRILATAISRLRAKLKYRPVVFELLPPEFTLTELQRTVEAISGRHLHKQNFRRLVEGTALVEPTGETSTTTGGRPAARYRFRREVLRERPSPGFRLGAR